MQKYLLTYDTVHGQFKGTVEVNAAGHLVVDGHEIVVYAEYDSLALSLVCRCVAFRRPPGLPMLVFGLKSQHFANTIWLFSRCHPTSLAMLLGCLQSRKPNVSLGSNIYFCLFLPYYLVSGTDSCCVICVVMSICLCEDVTPPRSSGLNMELTMSSSRLVSSPRPRRQAPT